MLLKLLLLFISFTVLIGQENTTEKYILESKVFENKRMIRVLLPKNYDDKNSYKVLYLNDGQNLFGDNNFGSEYEWRVDEIYDSLESINVVEPMIIVGIDHGKESRDSEYVPWEDRYRKPALPNPAGKKYPEFLFNEVVPFIEGKYNVKRGAENRGIGGASHGGLISLYTALTNQDKFGFVIAESPTIYVNDYKIFELVKRKKSCTIKKIYFAMGSNESGLEPCDEEFKYNKLAVNDTRKIEKLFKSEFKNSEILTVIEECANHHETSWSRRFPTALKFVSDPR